MTQRTTPPHTGCRRRVLVVEDDPDARWLARDALTEHGFEVSEASDGADARKQIDNRRPDLVILDLGLPDISGLEILRMLEGTETAVIILTGRVGQSDRIVGLELGADDYVVKPFDPRELVARTNAVLRRGRPAVAPRILDYGVLTIDLTTRDVTCGTTSITLTAKEFGLLAFLAGSPRQVFSREQLLENVWGSSAEWQDSSTVSEHIYRLRRKIEPDPTSPTLIGTLRGAGYRFTPPSADIGTHLEHADHGLTRSSRTAPSPALTATTLR